jgi:hypothetical protein
MPLVQIVAGLREHYGESALSRTPMSFWINEVKQGQTDLNIAGSPEKEHVEGLAALIVGRLDANPHL